MSKKIRAILTGAATAAVFLAGVAAHAQSDPTDCKAERPPENSRDDALEVEPGESLSDELATCGSVLDPPPVGDPDVVQPAPQVDDPIVIQPDENQQPARRRGT